MPVRDERRADISVHVETQLRIQTGITGIEEAIVFLLRTFRIVSQLLHLISSFRPGAMKVDPLLGKYWFVVTQKPDFILPLRPPMIKLSRVNPVPPEFPVRHHDARLYLDHGPQFLIEQYGRIRSRNLPPSASGRNSLPSISFATHQTQLIEIYGYSSMAGKRHLA